MVKERKTQFGATNLSARSDASNANSSIKKDEPVNFTRSWTHKLISPDVYQPKDAYPENVRQISNTATWLPLAIHNRDFNSTTTASFVDPRKIPVKVRKTRTTKEIEDDTKRTELQGEAMEALSKVAKKCYGTTGAMLKSFNKKSGDTVHIDEFGGYLKRNKLDMYISENDRKNIFDAVDPKHDGSIQVSALLQRTEEQEFHESEHKKDMIKIRDFLSQHVKNNRASSPEQKRIDPNLEIIKKKKAVENEGGLIKMALGTKAFDLDISADELQSVINSMYEKFPDDEGHRQFARFLKLSNLNLDTIPFYDMRKENLEALKHRAATIEQTLHSDELQDRFKTLSETRWRGSLAASHSSTGLAMGGIATGSPLLSSHGKESPVLSLSMSLPNLNISTSSPSKLPPRRGQLTSLQHKPHKNLLVHSTPGAEYDNDGIQSIVSRSASSLVGSVHEGGGSLTSAVSGGESPTAKSIRTRKLKEELFDSGEARASDFYTQVVDSGVSMGRMKDPTKVMRIEKIDPLAYSPQGRRTMGKGPTDWSRVGIGGDRAPDDVGYGRAGSGDDRFSTTNSEFFTPLIYQPSQPVTRAGVSDAEAATQMRNYRRKERHDRMAANMDVTKTRLEYEAVEKGMREMRNQHSQVIDKIRYETAMLLNDLQSYKKQPLQRMNRKPNLNLSDKMWGGNQGKQTVVLVAESRDFNTTYNSSFQSSSLISK